MARSSDNCEFLNQKFQFLCVIDFDATCLENAKPDPQEVIQVCANILHVGNDFQKPSTFHSFVKPIYHSILSEFCKDLTGITQEQVDSAKHFPQIFRELCDWYKEYILDHDCADNTAWITFGNWDFRLVFTEEYKLTELVKDIPEMMNLCELKFEG